MRNKTIMLLMLGLLVCILPFAVADLDNQSQDHLENESLALNTTQGAEMRLTQLSLAIERNIAKGEGVITDLKNSSKNTSKLEDILAQMNVLLDEVNNADPAADNRVAIFVSLKSQAINLSWQFKTEARSLVSQEKADQIRDHVKNKTNSKIEELKKKVNDKKVEFNRLYALKVLQLLGINDSEIINKVNAMNFTMKDIKDDIKEMVKNMTKEERKNSFMNLKEHDLKKRISNKQKVDAAKLQIRQDMQQRLKERLDKNKDRIDDLKQQMRERRLNMTGQGNSTRENGRMMPPEGKRPNKDGKLNGSRMNRDSSSAPESDSDEGDIQ